MQVLILIVMEERIGSEGVEFKSLVIMNSLNPYCNGRKNRMKKSSLNSKNQKSLNPYCNGRKNRIEVYFFILITWESVLILIVMEERIGWEELYVDRTNKSLS